MGILRFIYKTFFAPKQIDFELAFGAESARHASAFYEKRHGNAFRITVRDPEQGDIGVVFFEAPFEARKGSLYYILGFGEEAEEISFVIRKGDKSIGRVWGPDLDDSEFFCIAPNFKVFLTEKVVEEAPSE